MSNADRLVLSLTPTFLGLGLAWIVSNYPAPVAPLIYALFATLSAWAVWDLTGKK